MTLRQEKIGNATLYLGDCREVLKGLGPFNACVTDPPYHLTPIVKRFGKPGSAPAQEGTDGAFARASRGFMGKEWDGGDVSFRPETWALVCAALKPGAHLLAFAGTRTQHRIACAIEDAGFDIRDMIAWVYGSGFPKSKNLDGEWNGWGTALKPALEPITFARKPLIGTVAENVLEHGTGALNVDGCRVQHQGQATTGRRITENRQNAVVAKNTSKLTGSMNDNWKKGRWPANLIHDGSEEVLVRFPQSVAGVETQQRGTGGIWSGRSNAPCGPQYGDNGSAARFFYCAKASQEDRDDGLEGFEKKNGSQITGRVVGSSGAKASAYAGTTEHLRRNIHPTVKPTDLMRYLCRLVTPPGGVVLDPFMGSGSTGKGALKEGFRFVGIERDPEYFEIACKRIEDAQKQGRLEMEACT